MRLALIGASGFVGSAVFRRLATQHEIRTVGRHAPPSVAGWLQLDLVGLVGLVGPAGPAAPGLAEHLAGCEALVDAAALNAYRADPPDDLLSLERVNLGIPLQIGRALPVSVRRIVYLSTIDVYGPPESLPLTEEAPAEPTTNYARTKRLAEQAYLRLCGERGMDLLILRLSQVYGPGDTSPKLVPSAVRSAVRERRIPRLAGTGAELRDLIYVDDVAACVELALRGPPGVYNVATGSSRPVRDVPRILAALTGLPDPGCDGMPTGKPSYAFDLAKARGELGFRPAISLEQGLELTLEWMQSQSSS